MTHQDFLDKRSQKRVSQCGNYAFIFRSKSFYIQWALFPDGYWNVAPSEDNVKIWSLSAFYHLWLVSSQIDEADMFVRGNQTKLFKNEGIQFPALIKYYQHLRKSSKLVH